MEINTGTRDAIRYAKQYPERFSKALMPAADRMGYTVAQRITETQFSGDPLNTVTGMLKAAVAHRVVIIGSSIVIAIGVLRGPATKYAEKQEKGGEIKASAGKALAVPLPAAITGTGRPKYPRGPLDPRISRDYPGGTFLHKKKGSGKAPVVMGIRLVAGGGRKKVAEIVPLFALVRSVYLTPTNWLSDGVLLNVDAGSDEFNRELDRRLFGD